MINIVFENHSFVRIECDDSIFYEMREYFSFKADGYQFSPKFKYGGWSGDIFLLGYDRLLPFGLVDQAVHFANQNDYNVQIDPQIKQGEDITRAEFDAWLAKKEIYSGNTRIEPYWYQADAVFHGIKNRRAILNLPTSAGKSLIQSLIALWFLENYQGKVLVIVPTTALVTQMINDMVDYRLLPREALLGIKSGTAKDSDALVYVSTWQSAVKQKREWFNQFGCVLNDECFDGDTLIKTPSGDVKIKDLAPGDSIYSYNENTKEIVEDIVVKLHKNLTKSSKEKMYEMVMDTGQIIKVTGNHKFLTANRGWVRADKLTNMDDIIEWK